METSTAIALVTTIGGLAAILEGAFKLLEYVVKNIVNPLSLNITTLQNTTRELQLLIDRVKDDIASIDKRLTIVEQATKSMHKRMDTHLQIEHSMNVRHDS